MKTDGDAEVGSHVVNYAVEDAFGNVLDDEECTFIVEVKRVGILFEN